MDKTVDKIFLISRSDRKTLQEKCIKIQEEVGELAAEILKLKGKKGTKGLSKEQIENNILEETCDIIIMGFSLMYKMRFKKERIIKAFNKKLNKAKANLAKQVVWENHIREQNAKSR
jgi:NTP pyrophosphatase (non-canonical NTP hydrolase)